MDKIKWCFKKGMEIVKPNSNLADAYLKKSEDSLESMRLITSKDWKISMAYYSMYFGLYSVLMKIGIKSEIHSCSIEIMKLFLLEYFDEDDVNLIEESFKARIDAQYYTNRDVNDVIYEDILSKVSEFVVKCKSIILKLNENDVEKIRDLIKNK